MIAEYTIPITLPEGYVINRHLGSLFHGVLMERFGSERAGAYHAMEIPPFAQHLLPDGRDSRTGMWRLVCLTKECADAVEGVMPDTKEIYLRQKGCSVVLGEIRRAVISRSELLEQAFEPQELPRRFELRFATTTSFKSGGEYQQFPSTALLYHSLMRRWDAFCDNVRMQDREAKDFLAENTRIRRYSLRSETFELEGQHVPGFAGWIELSVYGPEKLARLAALLLGYATYCGVGVKTALGMGAVVARPVANRSKETKG